MTGYERGFADGVEAAAKILLRANASDEKRVPGDSMVKRLVIAVRQTHADEILALAPSASGGDEARCERCGGTGEQESHAGSFSAKCPACGGRGHR